jgi:hypothetical protein
MKTVRRKRGKKEEGVAEINEISSQFYAWLQKCIALIEQRGLENVVGLYAACLSIELLVVIATYFDYNAGHLPAERRRVQDPGILDKYVGETKACRL